jgi:hypothetical protein
VVVNPDEALARIAREEGWRVMRFERLLRQLGLAALTTTILAAGLLGRNRIGAWKQPSSRSAALRAKRS